MFSLVITIDSKQKVLPIEPQVVSRGFIYMKDSEALTKRFVEEAKNYLNTEMSKVKLVNLNTLKVGLAEYLSRFIYMKTDRRPIVIPIVMDLARKF